MPAHIREAYSAIKNDMERLSEMIEYEDGVLDELTRNVFHEDELVDYSMTQQHYDSLTRGAARGTAGKGRKESVIPQWLGLPVQPPDPYQEGEKSECMVGWGEVWEWCLEKNCVGRISGYSCTAVPITKNSTHPRKV